MISIQDLQRLLGKKSKEQASGAISKLSADEWNTLVQGVIEHYGLLALDAEANTVTIRDSSGNAHIYELTPYVPEPEIETITYIITGNNHAGPPSFSAPQMSFDGTQKSTTLTYKAYKKITYKGNTTPDEYVEINSSSVPEATVTVTYEIVGESEYNLAITNTGKITCDSNSGTERDVGYIIAKIALTVNNQLQDSWTSDNILVTQGAYVAPDYYIGFYSDPEDYIGASSDDLIENAKAHNIVSSKPIYPSANNYIYYSENEKLMYLIYNKNYNVLIDVDNPGTSIDLENLTVNDIAMTVFNKSDFTKNGKTYSIIATFDATNTSENGYRFKFTIV